jgi:hypothetical protein
MKGSRDPHIPKREYEGLRSTRDGMHFNNGNIYRKINPNKTNLYSRFVTYIVALWVLYGEGLFNKWMQKMTNHCKWMLI